MAAVRAAQSLEPIADAAMDRYLSPAFRTRHPGRWKQLRDTVVGTTPTGYLGCAAAILDFDFQAQLPEAAGARRLRRRGRRHPGRRKPPPRRARPRRPL